METLEAFARDKRTFILLLVTIFLTAAENGTFDFLGDSDNQHVYVYVCDEETIADWVTHQGWHAPAPQESGYDSGEGVGDWRGIIRNRGL